MAGYDACLQRFYYHIWTLRPSCSCDPDAANKLSFPLPKEAPHKIWLRLAERFWKRRCLKMWTDDDGRTTIDAEPLVYYKFTNEGGGGSGLM